MQQMDRSEVEISVSVEWFSVEFDGQCRPYPDDQNIQKWIAMPDYVSISELKGMPSKPDHNFVMNVPKFQWWFAFFRVKSNCLKMLYVDVTNERWQRASHSHAIFLLQVPIVHLKIYGSQTNF
jgi:hypothetical protein